MELLHHIVPCFLIFPYFCLADEAGTTARLLNIELQLKTVLESNEELAQRVFQLQRKNEVFEEENRNIKETNIEMKKQILDMQKAITDLQASVHGQRSSPAKRFVSDFQGSAVAFTAVVSPPQITNLGSGQTIVYDLTVTNVGGAYHNGSGVFTAPLNGVYVFNYAVMVDPGFSEYIELVKNGDHIIWNYGHAPGSNHLVSASRTATVELQAGDQVWTRTQATSTHGDGIIHGNTFTTFSGWLITLYE